MGLVRSLFAACFAPQDKAQVDKSLKFQQQGYVKSRHSSACEASEDSSLDSRPAAPSAAKNSPPVRRKSSVSSIPEDYQQNEGPAPQGTKGPTLLAREPSNGKPARASSNSNGSIRSLATGAASDGRFLDGDAAKGGFFTTSSFSPFQTSAALPFASSERREDVVVVITHTSNNAINTSQVTSTTTTTTSPPATLAASLMNLTTEDSPPLPLEFCTNSAAFFQASGCSTPSGLPPRKPVIINTLNSSSNNNNKSIIIPSSITFHLDTDATTISPGPAFSASEAVREPSLMHGSLEPCTRNSSPSVVSSQLPGPLHREVLALANATTGDSRYSSSLGAGGGCDISLNTFPTTGNSANVAAACRSSFGSESTGRCCSSGCCCSLSNYTMSPTDMATTVQHGNQRSIDAANGPGDGAEAGGNVAAVGRCGRCGGYAGRKGSAELASGASSLSHASSPRAQPPCALAAQFRQAQLPPLQPSPQEGGLLVASPPELPIMPALPPAAGSLSTSPHSTRRTNPADNFLRFTDLETCWSELKDLSFIGSGSSGNVYSGTWCGVPVAVKFMITGDPSQLQRQQREAALSRLASHPHLVQTYAVAVAQLTHAHFRPQEPNASSRGGGGTGGGNRVSYLTDLLGTYAGGGTAAELYGTASLSPSQSTNAGCGGAGGYVGGGGASEVGAGMLYTPASPGTGVTIGSGSRSDKPNGSFSGPDVTAALPQIGAVAPLASDDVFAFNLLGNCEPRGALPPSQQPNPFRNFMVQEQQQQQQQQQHASRRSGRIKAAIAGTSGSTGGVSATSAPDAPSLLSSTLAEPSLPLARGSVPMQMRSQRSPFRPSQLPIARSVQHQQQQQQQQHLQQQQQQSLLRPAASSRPYVTHVSPVASLQTDCPPTASSGVSGEGRVAAAAAAESVMVVDGGSLAGGSAAARPLSGSGNFRFDRTSRQQQQQQNTGHLPSATYTSAVISTVDMALAGAYQDVDKADSFEMRVSEAGPSLLLFQPSDVLAHLGARPGQWLTCVIMEEMDKGSLHASIHASSGLFRPGGEWGLAKRHRVRAMVRSLLEVAQGMAHLHASGLVHGDLKPANVLLKATSRDLRGFTAKVSDFGVTRAMAEGASQASVSTSDWGTVVYTAPEVFNGRSGPASDVFSFGALLWHLTTGQLPHEDINPFAVMLAVSRGDLELEWPASVPKPLRKLGRLCMQFEPEGRPTFAQITRALMRLEERMRACTTGAAAGGARDGAGRGGGAGGSLSVSPRHGAGAGGVGGAWRRDATPAVAIGGAGGNSPRGRMQ
ncbi:hypothetical protein Agub_g9754 [Astrephomene gubernaculifera]|uniref:Protein kinase domain-containing protein n=1 Tax=Astrephomene gubernaculifera TaxID=47775 RepID=A0AAD3DTS8_9CHLO|nr:hypothetical protein Agub_g9754 [Astrephomene gubernaculifera]